MPYLFNLVYMALIAVASPWLVYQALRKPYGEYRAGDGLAAKSSWGAKCRFRRGQRPRLVAARGEHGAK